MSCAGEMRRAGLIGGEIRSTHDYRGGVSVDMDYAQV
jgi:hypothetical protein